MNHKLKKALFILLATVAIMYARGQDTDLQGYSPKVSSFGNYYKQLRADGIHLPHRYGLFRSSTDSTPEIFVWSTPAGDSAVIFVNGRYIVIGANAGSGGGGGCAGCSADSITKKKIDTAGMALGDTIRYMYYDPSSSTFKLRRVNLPDVIRALGYAPLSILDTAYIVGTKAWRQKGLDSLAGVINGLLALKKNANDSAGSTASFTTRGWLYHVLDSLNALISFTNYRSVGATGSDIFNFSTAGTQTNITFPKIRDTTGNYLGYAADSGFVIPLSARLLKTDSNGSAGYLTHGAWDSSRTNLWAAIAARVVNLGGAAGIKAGAYLSRPSASNSQTFYWSTDSAWWSYDGAGPAWKDLKPGSGGGGGSTGANPTALAGTAAVNGSATTFMRSDAAPAVDTSKFATLYNTYKNNVASDTLWRIVYGIPQPDISGGTTQATPMPWKWLITGGGHAQSPDMDSCIFVASNGHILFGFGNAEYVAGADLVGDELTYPLKVGFIGNFDNYEAAVSVQSSGLGMNLVGNNTNTWQTQSSQLYNYALTFDSTTIGGALTLSFDLADGASMGLGSTVNGTVVNYNGSNGYQTERVWSGLTRSFKYQFRDIMGNIVTGYPQTTDRISIFNGSSNWNAIDCRQFLNSTAPYFGSSLANWWFMAVIKLYPENQRVSRPGNFQAIASATPGQINVTWNASTNVTNGYVLDRCTQANFASGVTNLINGTTVTSYNDTGLTTGTKYWYRIKAQRTFPQNSGWKLVGPITAP